MNRRQILKRAGAAGIVGLAGYGVLQSVDDPPSDDDPPDGRTTRPGTDTTTRPETGRPTEERTTEDERTATEGEPPDVRHADSFANVVDVVEAGADPSGSTPINAVLERHAGEDTLLSFRPGTYRVRPLELSGYEKLGIAAAGNERPTFVGVKGTCRDQPYLRFEDVSAFLVDGVDFDFTPRGAGGGVRILASGDATVTNASFQGSCPAQVAAFRIDVQDENGSALVRNVKGVNERDRKLTGFFVGKSHAGEVTFEACEAVGFSDNGLYASVMGLPDGENGTVHTVGGRFHNNNISNVRLGSTNSTAKGVTVKVDDVPPGETVNSRGIRLRNRRGQVVDDCSVTFGANAARSFGAVVFHGDNAGGLVKDTNVHVDTPDVPAVHAFAPNQPDSDPPVFRNVEITGEAPGWYTATLYRRDGTTFEKCRIQQMGENRAGLRFKNASDCKIVDSHIETTRAPLIARYSTVHVKNTTLVTPDGERHVQDRVFENEVVDPS